MKLSELKRILHRHISAVVFFITKPLGSFADLLSVPRLLIAFVQYLLPSNNKNLLYKLVWLDVKFLMAQRDILLYLRVSFSILAMKGHVILIYVYSNIRLQCVCLCVLGWGGEWCLTSIP